ncbi:recombinase family protein [uncultured Clostridium sp.]|uniref:recombinase family protein n=1 Tax=uncultured Clostridium sp. TaxID=59620 RepID=UPI002730FD0D|nr:recombinase family protein [uncultured Clostridium sp.]
MKKIAIYSRKSVFSEKGDSIENQIKLCKNYCEANFSEDLEYIIYEDEGFSGKNLNRPKFKELINDIKANKLNLLICYRLDRISRNVADFSSTLEMLQKYNVGFVSIKEQFDTTTPMGRAMIYIASVFAQLERETIAERVKDNMLQLAKMGKWSGGRLPLGFTSEKITYLNSEMKEKTLVKLIPIDSELETIKFIYNTYLSKGSILATLNELNTLGYKTKLGLNFELSGVKRILKSPIYVISNQDTNNYLKKAGYEVFGVPNGNGYLSYTEKSSNISIVAVAGHKGIISSDDWLYVQRRFDYNKQKIKTTSSRSGTGQNNSLFSGLLKCSKCGSNMVIKYNSKNKYGANYIYYVCSGKQKTNSNKKCNCPNLRTDLVDDIIINKIKSYNKDIIIAAYNNKLEELKLSTNKQITIDITKNINEKNIQIKNLIRELSLTTDESVRILLRDEISSINLEITKLKEKLHNSNEIQNDIHDLILNVKQLLISFKEFHKSFDECTDINTKRTLLKDIIESITYDIENKNFNINFITLDTQLDSIRQSMDCNLYSSKR